MSDYVKPWPHCPTVEQLRDYLDWHVAAGRGQYALEIREHYVAVPPTITHDDDERRVFLAAGFPMA